VITVTRTQGIIFRRWYWTVRVGPDQYEGFAFTKRGAERQVRETLDR
jgi:hypothetical protein